MTMRGVWVESYRQHYRQRFMLGCNVPPFAVKDIQRGFEIESDGCDAATFVGFEFIQAPGSDVASLPKSGS